MHPTRFSIWFWEYFFFPICYHLFPKPKDIYDIYASYSFLSLHGYVVRKRVCLSHIIKTFDLLDEAAQDFQHAVYFFLLKYIDNTLSKQKSTHMCFFVKYMSW